MGEEWSKRPEAAGDMVLRALLGSVYSATGDLNVLYFLI